MNEQNSTQFDDQLIHRLRELARAGRPIAELVGMMRSVLARDGDSALLLVRYFMEAFDLTLREARKIEGARCMGNDAISDDELDALLRPFILRSLG